MQAGKLIEVGVLKNEVIRAAKDGDIDDPANLRNSNVFVFCGTLDTVVTPSKSNPNNQYP